MKSLKRWLGVDARTVQALVAGLGIVMGGCQAMGQPTPGSTPAAQTPKQQKEQQKDLIKKIIDGWNSRMQVVGDPQYGLRTQGWISTNVVPNMPSMQTPGGYDALGKKMTEIFGKADQRLQGAALIGTPQSLAQPLNVSGAQGLRSLLEQQVRTPFDSVLAQMDQNNLNAYNQQITIARNATENGEPMTMDELLKLAPYPQQDMTLINGVPNILRTLINMADTLGGTAPGNSAILGFVADISSTYARMADVRSKVVTDHDLAGYNNPVNDFVQQRSLSDQSNFTEGSSLRYGRRPFANTTLNTNSVYQKGEPLYVQKALLKNAIIMAGNISQYEPLPTSPERLQSAAMTLDNEDWNTVQMTPEDLFSRMVTLSIIYTATPKEARPGSLADIELQRQAVIAQSMLSDIQVEINKLQNGPMPGVPAQAQPQVRPQPLVGPAHAGRFGEQLGQCLTTRPIQPAEQELPGGR